MTSWVPDHDIIPSSQEDYVPPAKRFRPNQNNSCAPYISMNSDWPSWDSATVADRLDEAGLAEVAQIFKAEDIEGNVLPRLNEDHLEKLGITKLGKRLQVCKFIEEVVGTAVATDLNDIESQRKVFNDPIHGHIDLHPLCVKIVDTPIFQRLRFLKQLGTCYFVYPGASHNRFEHSLGVCHLAGQLVRAIQRRQPRLNITHTDILCVEIAGLCHDLGHGPFSHLFDGKFIPAARPGTKWKHETASKEMFHYMLEDPELRASFTKYGLSDLDIIFIEEQVAGPWKKTDGKEWQYEGRPKEKSFLYEVVANKRNGIDVDKWDYFSRDCHMLGIRNNFDHHRCIQFARVIEVDGELQICSRDKEVGNLYDMFHTRSTLHRRAYQHKVTNAIDAMITEAFVKADKYLKFKGTDGKMLRMSETIDDMVAFSQLSDYVFFQILHSTQPELEESRQILQNVLRRKLYKCVAQTQLSYEQTIKEDDVQNIKKEIFDKMDPDERKASPLKHDSIVILLAYMDYGMKGKNPIDNVRFYSKEEPNTAIRIRKDQVSQMLPEKFAEQLLRVHSKVNDKRSINMIMRAFTEWCRERNYPLPKGGDISSLELTPDSKKDGQSTPDRPITNRDSKNGTPSSAGKFRARLSFE